MRHRVIFIGILLSILFVFCNKSQQDDSPVLKDLYLAQKLPGMTLEIIAPDISA